MPDPTNPADQRLALERRLARVSQRLLEARRYARESLQAGMEARRELDILKSSTSWRLAQLLGRLRERLPRPVRLTIRLIGRRIGR